MNASKMWRLTGICGLISVVLWLCIFPLYMVGDNPPTSVYDGVASAEFLFKIHNFVFTRILLGLVLYVALMVFAVGFRDLVRRANPDYEWLGTLLVAAMGVWVGVTLVANGMEGGAALDTLGGNADPSVVRALTEGYLLIYNGAIAFVITGLFLGAAGYATFAIGILPRWTGWLAYIATALCAISVPTMYVGAVDYTKFYNVGGFGAAIIANFPPLFWFLAVSVLMLRKSRQLREQN